MELYPCIIPIVPLTAPVTVPVLIPLPPELSDKFPGVLIPFTSILVGTDVSCCLYVFKPVISPPTPFTLLDKSMPLLNFGILFIFFLYFSSMTIYILLLYIVLQ
uniref:Uncharacterized protein n=1 Tax=Podoviridae sp. ctsNK10 TaxID=2826582 RepID=A0A8S5NKD2_9CAUD|nr:MAG TPA: hypothetical protein [Podoviridae sp. ctsNK10]